MYSLRLSDKLVQAVFRAEIRKENVIFSFFIFHFSFSLYLCAEFKKICARSIIL